MAKVLVIVVTRTPSFRSQTGKQIGILGRQIPRGVAPHRMTAKTNSVGIDGIPLQNMTDGLQNIHFAQPKVGNITSAPGPDLNIVRLPRLTSSWQRSSTIPVKIDVQRGNSVPGQSPWGSSWKSAVLYHLPYKSNIPTTRFRCLPK